VTVREVMEVFNKRRKEEPVMVSPGITGRILDELGHRGPTLTGTSLSYAAPMCFGLALARPDLKVVAIEGDGSMVAGLSFLATLGRYPLKNLVLLVIDNETHLLTGFGGLPTATASSLDLQAVASGAGVRNVAKVTTVAQVEEWVQRALSEDGPFVLIVKVDRSGHRPTTRPPPNPMDRTEASVLFRRWLLNNPRRPGTSPALELKPRQVEVEENMPGKETGRAIYDAMKAAGIDLFVYLPESVTFPAQLLAERDRDMLAVCCAREDEGIAIASGAYYGGLLPAIVMEGSGVGYSALVLAGCILRRTPVLIVASHSESLGVRFDYDTTSRLTNEPILRALQIPYQVLKRVEDAPYLFRESVHEMRILKMPVGVVVPPYVMSERGLG